MLRTRSPVYSPLRVFSLDLHVLGTPPAFVLSQDQTLQLNRNGDTMFSSCPPDLECQFLLLTYFSHSKHCGIRNLCFVDLLSGFQRPSACCTTPDDQLPAPPRDGAALPTAVRGFVSRASTSALAHAPHLQGAGHVTPRSEGVKNPRSRRLRRRQTIGLWGRFLERLRPATDEVHLLAAARDARFRPDHADIEERSPAAAQE